MSVVLRVLRLGWQCTYGLSKLADFPAPSFWRSETTNSARGIWMVGSVTVDGRIHRAGKNNHSDRGKAPEQHHEQTLTWTKVV